MWRKVLIALGLIAAVFSMASLRTATAAPALKGVIGTASLGGDWYTFGVTLAKIASDHVPGLSLTVQTSGGGTENMRLLASKQVEFGFLIGPEVALAFKGQGAYEGKSAEFQKLRGILAAPFGGVQIVTLAGSNIKTIADLKGKKFTPGAPGSSAASLFVPTLVGAHGITRDNTKFVYLNASGAIDALKNRQIDAFAFLQEPPLVHVTNLSVTEKIRLVTAERAPLDQALKALPGSYVVEVPADVYGKNQVNEAITLTQGVAMVIATREDLDSEVVYQFTKALWDNIDRYRAAGPQEKRLQLKLALQGMTIPLHPGTERYYREKGVLK